MSIYKGTVVDQLEQFIRLLRESLAMGIQQEQLKALVGRADNLLIIDMGAPIASLINDIRELLQLHFMQHSHMSAGDVEILNVACDWLVQLQAMQKDGLPIPHALLAEVHHSFKLAIASYQALNKSKTVNIDPFAEDMDIDESYSTVNLTDPFAGDPGLNSSFERLQQTIIHAKSLATTKKQVEDPFAMDPVLDQEEVKEQGNSLKGEHFGDAIDIFSDDPGLSID